MSAAIVLPSNEAIIAFLLETLGIKVLPGAVDPAADSKVLCTPADLKIRTMIRAQGVLSTRVQRWGHSVRLKVR